MYQQIFELQANFLKALAHSRRLEIVQLLQDQELSVTEIYQMLDLPQANISQHLSILKDAGILSARKHGKQIYYQITDLEIVDGIFKFRNVLFEKYKDSKIADEFTLQMDQLVPVVHDPVCQMRVSPKTASFACKHLKQTYFFCASGCLKKFQQHSEQYV